MDRINNPYAVAFGRIPTSYIDRDTLIDEIVSSFTSEYVDAQCYKLTGVRGSGKTVTMTAISQKLLACNDAWITVDLSASEQILQDLIVKLYDLVPFLTRFIDTELNLSAFGIGVSISANRPAASIDVAFEKILGDIKRRGKRLLITIDEISQSAEIIHFIKLFQQMVRGEYPIYFLAAGLHGKIEELENTEGLTFFYRAPKKKMEPLNLTLIRADYQKKLGVSRDVAEKMAYLTKGYAFAYQALGKYMWETGEQDITEDVMLRVDAALEEGAYKIIWRELSNTERLYVRFLCQKDVMEVSELLELTKKKGSEWSRPRKNLLDKDLLRSPRRGAVEFVLPRFKDFIDNRMFED